MLSLRQFLALLAVLLLAVLMHRAAPGIYKQSLRLASRLPQTFQTYFATPAPSFAAPPTQQKAPSAPAPESASASEAATDNQTPRPKMSAPADEQKDALPQEEQGPKFQTQPSMYISHGSPTVVLQDRSPAHQFMHRLGAHVLHGYSKKLEGAEVKPPAGIVIISAHWTTYNDGPVVSAAGPKPRIIYDFGGGFPRALFQYQYHHEHLIVGSPKLAGHVSALFNAESSEEVGKVLGSIRRDGLSGIPAGEAPVDVAEAPKGGWKNLESKIDARRGWDHGVWTVLGPMFPGDRPPHNEEMACCDAHLAALPKLEKPIPVVQVSLPLNHNPVWLYRQMGERLAWLRRENIMVIGSGAAVHNLGQIDFDYGVDHASLRFLGADERWRAIFNQLKATPRALSRWANDFADWLKVKVRTGDNESVVDFIHAPNQSGRLAHPSDEHFLPLLVTMGAGSSPWLGDGANPSAGVQIHDGFEFGNLGTHAFAWPSQEFPDAKQFQ